MKEEIILTDEQKEEILNLFKQLPSEELTLLNITQIVFKNKKLNGQSREGRSVKSFLGSQNLEFKTRTNKPLGNKELTEDQKKKLDANLVAYIKKDIGSLELAKIIFENESLTSLHQETRTVVNYLNAAIDKMDGDEFKKLTFSGSMEDVAKEEYKPPKSLVQTLFRINKYVVGGEWKEGALKSNERKCAQALQNYLNTFRVKYEISSYLKESQREIFEDAFVRYTYDKPDLTQEDLDQFCTLTSERVNEVTIKAEINLMTQAIERQNSDSEGRKIAMGLVEAINSARTELNQCLNRQGKLFDSLVQKRSKKLDEENREYCSILPLAIAWREEEFRHRYAHLGKLKQQALKEEIRKVGSLSEVQAMVRGLSIEEVIGESMDD